MTRRCGGRVSQTGEAAVTKAPVELESRPASGAGAQ